ncbi:tail sheath stabilizer and completion protein [Aeromonas phage Ah1]|uniref:Tail sheath stabilizer and completion protein n=1 Tax=Aeromonas phage Ah1 TaxID=2053701 RepID=A0A2H4YF09_9CAUD|nr:tail sheath stabilizer and completion protein [Aeromonas phage Ah1]AUE22751.1 tail sheath stabilizer and completion protein [Aeromonas phage Ah1]
MFGYFYNSISRRYIVLMGQLFNGVQVARERDGKVSYQKVPITYASKERFTMKLNSVNSNIDEHGVARIETILPRMNLELIDMVYNPMFKTGVNVRSQSLGAGTSVSRNNPVPYKYMFNLSIATRFEDDMFQIVEQILPYFQPNFTTKITELHDSLTPVDRDIQITIQGLSISEDLEGASTERRRIQWDITFELDGWLYPPIANLKGEIKTIYLDFYSNKTELKTSEENFESVDFEVDPRTTTKENWDGKYIQTTSENIPIPKEPTKPGPRGLKHNE